jgi:hypothetical protein
MLRGPKSPRIKKKSDYYSRIFSLVVDHNVWVPDSKIGIHTMYRQIIGFLYIGNSGNNKFESKAKVGSILESESILATFLELHRSEGNPHLTCQKSNHKTTPDPPHSFPFLLKILTPVVVPFSSPFPPW